MMAPYAIAHMKVSLKLTETGYRFGTEERAQIYLTNALEPWVKQLPLFDFDALAHEAAAVNRVKNEKKFTVVIGNPPYSGMSANMSEAIVDSVAPYKEINGISLGERKIWAQDDYKKFIRLSQLAIANSGCGILGFITNHGYINEPTSRGMRHNLQATFPRISIIDLHGNKKKREISPDGSPDQNVFDIQQGVSISFLRRGGSKLMGVTHGDLWGRRSEKFDWLLQHTFGTTTWAPVVPSPEFYLFVPQNEDTKIEYFRYTSIKDVFDSGSSGIQTSRDHVTYGLHKREIRDVIEDFRLPESSFTTADLREKYWPGKQATNSAAGDTPVWNVQDARQNLRGDAEWETKFRQALYRPFDTQTLFYADYMIHRTRAEVMNQMLRPNLALCVGRAGGAAGNQEWNIIFVTNTLVDMNLFYRGGNVSYPLRIAPVEEHLSFDNEPRVNFTEPFLRTLSRALNLPQEQQSNLPAGVSAEGIFHYVYAVLHSPIYRRRYAEFLKIDFPRIPLIERLELFQALARVGSQLTALHLLEAPQLNQPVKAAIGGQQIQVRKVTWSDSNVWVNEERTEGFSGVSESVWNFHVGGYQVCEKWLKDRKHRSLSQDEITHFYKIVTALETIRLMEEIDSTIDLHGGWPDAFSAPSVGGISTGGSAVLASTTVIYEK